MEHPHGLGLVTATGGNKLLELRPRLLLVGGGASAIEALGTTLRRDERGQIGELPGLQRDELIAGLTGLQHSDRRLACREEPTGLGPGRVEALYHAGLDAQRVLITGKGVLPAGLRVACELLRRRRRD